MVADYIYLQNADQVFTGPLLCDFCNICMYRMYSYEAKFSLATFSFT